MAFTVTFIKLLLHTLYLAGPLLLFLCCLIIVLGQIVGRVEKWSKFDALYWSFITALTVGYGDIRPVRRRSKVISILIALSGVMLTGIFVAITVKIASESFNRVIGPVTFPG